MAEQNDTEFIKNPSSKNRRITIAKVIDRVPMNVGGAYKDEDLKFFLVLQLSRAGKSKNAKFVGKEFMSLYKDEVKEVVEVYDTARHLGLRVPPTTRYFETEEGLPALLMTDMTENGKYRLWGYNDNFTEDELDTLHSMNLKDEDIASIEEQAEKTMDIATKNNFLVEFHNYQIRQKVGTRDFDIVLLDLDTINITWPKDYIPKANNVELTSFIETLTKNSQSDRSR